jgi:hypothetical protein
MQNNINIIWNVLSAILEENFAFSNIKQIVGLSGFDRTILSDMEQKYSGGSSKSQLINEIDKNIKELSSDDFKHFVNIATEEILERDVSLKPKLDKYLERLGWQLYNNQIIPIEIFDLSELQELDENSHQDLIKATIRFRDGDLSGAMTSICSSIDSLTNDIYTRYALGNPNTASFQERCNKSIQALNVLDDIETELIALGWDTSEVNHFKKNIKDSLNKLALVTQKLRSGMGDVHGSKPVLKSLVFDSFKFAQILIRMLT